MNIGNELISHIDFPLNNASTAVENDDLDLSITFWKGTRVTLCI